MGPPTRKIRRRHHHPPEVSSLSRSSVAELTNYSVGDSVEGAGDVWPSTGAALCVFIVGCWASRSAWRFARRSGSHGVPSGPRPLASGPIGLRGRLLRGGSG